MKRLALTIACCCWAACSATAGEPVVLFDGTSTERWQFREGAWVIEEGTLTCRMEQVQQKNGETRTRGMGYIWTKNDYSDFELKLSYKLSEAANSGVFYRTDPDNPVQGGFEIQLMDDAGVLKVRDEIEGKKRNGSFYDCQAPMAYPGKPAGQWNQMTLTCKGPNVRVEINGVLVVEVNVDDWDTAQKNPDGTPNKFKTALKDLPRVGKIGFQNHGQVAWFKDVVVTPL